VGEGEDSVGASFEGEVRGEEVAVAPY